MGTLQSVAREGLQRSAPFRMVAAEGGEAADGRTLTGYAAVFGQSTLIDSWEGTFTETIRKGAFKKSIRENTPVMQFDHGRHPLIGSIPIGRIEELREDDEGLYVSGRLTDNWLIQPVRDAIAEETVNGMSFRFTVIRDEWRDNTGKVVKPEELLDLLWMPGDRGPLERTLIELRVPELGPVVFPAYDGTSVGVRARGLAAGIAADDQMTREIRQSLARDMAAPQVPQDPELRTEVARALLFQRSGGIDPEEVARVTRETLQSIRVTAAPPADGHPATSTNGAPPAQGHPLETPDAPPADGHPSQPARANPLRDRIREITGLMGEALALIDEKDKS